MADKAKRLRKILTKRGLLKPVATLEEAHMVVVENERNISNTMVIGRDTYELYLQEGYTFPEHLVHYTVSSNPRNTVNIERKIMTNSFGDLKPALT